MWGTFRPTPTIAAEAVAIGPMWTPEPEVIRLSPSILWPMNPGNAVVVIAAWTLVCPAAIVIVCEFGW